MQSVSKERERESKEKKRRVVCTGERTHAGRKESGDYRRNEENRQQEKERGRRDTDKEKQNLLFLALSRASCAYKLKGKEKRDREIDSVSMEERLGDEEKKGNGKLFPFFSLPVLFPQLQR